MLEAREFMSLFVNLEYTEADVDSFLILEDVDFGNPMCISSLAAC